jgi:hypothetical protein
MGEYRDRFELEQHWAVRFSDVAEALLRHTPHIVHFSGHGTQAGTIVLAARGRSKSFRVAAPPVVLQKCGQKSTYFAA